jgi:hypothetical protein
LFAWAFGSPTITEPRMQQALAQFVRAMVSHDSRWDAGYARVFSPLRRTGRWTSTCRTSRRRRTAAATCS